MRSYWPVQLGNPQATDDDRYIAQRYAFGIPITVVSNSLTVEDVAPYGAHTTIVPRSAVKDAISELRRRDGDVLVFGSRTLWTSLLAQGLVDILYLLIGPKIVAGDHHAFNGVPVTNLHLLDARRMDGSETVVLTYQPANAEAS